MNVTTLINKFLEFSPTFREHNAKRVGKIMSEYGIRQCEGFRLLCHIVITGLEFLQMRKFIEKFVLRIQVHVLAYVTPWEIKFVVGVGAIEVN